MAIKEKLLVYPYNSEFTPILRHRYLLKDYEISRLVSPNGWGFIERDAGLADHGPDIGILVSRDFEKSLEFCDTLLFIESYFPIDSQKIIYKIKMAAKNKKNIICLIKLDSETIKDIEYICDSESVYFKYFYGNQTILPKEITFENESIEKINTPIILVAGMAERTNKFEIQLGLREKILNLGYKVSQVGTRPYCDIMGFHSFPTFMYKDNNSEVKKVLMFNKYIKKLEDIEQPDVMIIGIPGGIMPFNETFTNKFGILAFEISQAVTPDVSVLAMLYEDYKPEAFEIYANSIKYKLGFDVDGISISNNQFDWARAYEEKVLSYTSIDSYYLDEKIRNYGRTKIPVFNVLNVEDSNFLTDFIIRKLIEYDNVRVV